MSAKIGGVAPHEEVTVMDGSMGRYLTECGVPQDALFKTVWSARALVDPKWHDKVVEAHRAYIDAGAEILITNAYGVQPTYYKRAFGTENGAGTKFLLEAELDASLDWYDRMIRDAELASRLAVRAREESKNLTKDSDSHPTVRIFGCLPPLAESHQPQLFFELLENEGEEFICKAFRDLALAALSGGADGLMLENLVCIEEAELALRALSTLPKANNQNIPVMLSMEGALRDRTRAPQPWEAPHIARLALRWAKERSTFNLEALGFSCTEPETITESFQAIRAVPGEDLFAQLREAGIRLSAHANLNDRRQAHREGFKVEDDASKIKKREDLVANDFDGYVGLCRDLTLDFGVCILGGCCGCGPDGIRAIEHSLRGKGRRTSSMVSTATHASNMTQASNTTEESTHELEKFLDMPDMTFMF